MKHCFPTIRQIVDKVNEVQKVSDGLRNVYVMTNAAVPWLEELKAVLMKVYNWDQVASTEDLELSWEQKHIAQTVDMMIGQRAQVFIGNGVRHLAPFFTSRVCLMVLRSSSQV
jgi:2-succinyl-5-enolpyruvyl-6-hydroxy-3-cyclohexene-1-carboxylate synthase